MFKEMRRLDRETTPEKAMEILDGAQYGFLSTIGENGYPYAVAVNHVMVDGKICFHCAAGVGAKIKNINANPKVCFSVAQDIEVLQQVLSTSFESAVAFGIACEVTGESKMKVLEKLVEKFAPEFAGALAYISKHAGSTGIYAIEIERITGKVRSKKQDE